MERRHCGIRSERPDLGILDLMLPDRDEWEITRSVRANETLVGLPIIMLTARFKETDRIVGLELGVDNYSTNLFNPREVIACGRYCGKLSMVLSHVT